MLTLKAANEIEHTQNNEIAVYSDNEMWTKYNTTPERSLSWCFEKNGYDIQYCTIYLQRLVSLLFLECRNKSTKR